MFSVPTAGYRRERALRHYLCAFNQRNDTDWRTLLGLCTRTFDRQLRQPGNSIYNRTLGEEMTRARRGLS